MINTNIPTNSITLVITNKIGNKVYTITNTNPSYDKILDIMMDYDSTAINNASWNKYDDYSGYDDSNDLVDVEHDFSDCDDSTNTDDDNLDKAWDLGYSNGFNAGIIGSTYDSSLDEYNYFSYEWIGKYTYAYERGYTDGNLAKYKETHVSPF